MKLLSRLVIALAICLMVIPMMATPVQADPGFSLSGGSIAKGKGYVGDEVRIYGSWDKIHGSYIYIYYELYGEDEEDWYYKRVGYDYKIYEAAVHTGYYFDYDLEIPESYAMEHDILICDDDDPDDVVASLHFTVHPSIEIDEEEGPAGTEVKVTGYGWDRRESEIEIRFYLEDPGTTHYDDDDYYVVVASQDIEIDDDIDHHGTWKDKVTFDVPPSKKGDHWIYAVGDRSDDIKDDKIKGVEFEVSPGISLDIVEGSPGDTITVTGSGFEEDEKNIKVTYDDVVVAEVSKATEDGTWEVTFEVPQSVKGKHEIDASGYKTDAKYIADKDFTVVPDLVLSPTEGHVGTTLTVRGSGFPKDKPVTITYDEVTQGSKTTDSKGSFSGISFAAKGMHGKQTIKATYDSATLSAEFTMESTAPPTPLLTSPATGERVGFVGRKFTPTFEWRAISEADEPSGISHYVLEIANNEEFTTEAISFSRSLTEVDLTINTELNTVSYTLPQDSALPYGSYYWRVKAVDNAQNEGNPSVPYSFKSGILPFWALIAIAALIAVLIGVLVYLFAFRRRAGYE